MAIKSVSYKNKPDVQEDLSLIKRIRNVIENNHARFSITLQSMGLARDLATEITVGGDRFDRNDFHYFLRLAGATVDDFDRLRKDTIALAADMQPDGYESSTIDFFNRSLDYWLDKEAYKKFCKPNVLKNFAYAISHDVNSDIVSLDLRTELHKYMVVFNIIPEDLPNIRQQAYGYFDNLHNGQATEEYIKSFDKGLNFLLDKKAFSDVFKESVKDKDVEVKELSERVIHQEKRAAKKFTNKKRSVGVSM